MMQWKLEGEFGCNENLLIGNHLFLRAFPLNKEVILILIPLAYKILYSSFLFLKAYIFGGVGMTIIRDML